MTEDILLEALERWDMVGADFFLAAHRENAVFKVTHKTGVYALRLHRPGYRSSAELNAELDWMAYLNHGGISTPGPIVSINEQYCETINNVHVDMLSWLNGETLSKFIEISETGKIESVFFNLGKALAKLHSASDGWKKQDHFDRPKWDIDGLVGNAPLWNCFWENASLTEGQRNKFNGFRDKAMKILSDSQNELDYGLIHADAIPDNVLVDGEEVSLIDFDDCGFGFRLFDLATSINRIPNSPFKRRFKSSFIEGYRAHRKIDLEHLPLFIALRSLTYVGWIITRTELADAVSRQARFIVAAEQHIDEYEKVSA